MKSLKRSRDTEVPTTPAPASGKVVKTPGTNMVLRTPASRGSNVPPSDQRKALGSYSNRSIARLDKVAALEISSSTVRLEKVTEEISDSSEAENSDSGNEKKTPPTIKTVGVDVNGNKHWLTPFDKCNKNGLKCKICLKKKSLCMCTMFYCI